MTEEKSLYRKFFPDGFTLETSRVLLRLMQPGDLEAFKKLAADQDIWTFFRHNLADDAVLEKWFETLLAERQAETRMPFTVIDKDTHEICGSTSYQNISWPDSRIEIGSTWLGKNFIGMGINRPAKFALLSYAFEVMKMERVEIKTDNLNERSKAALLKVGMIPEGVLRSHSMMHGNRRRDTIYFSILKGEWEERKQSFFPDMLF
jgi:Acetyltransferases, including N-acetylases of ribosomal proteins